MFDCLDQNTIDLIEHKLVKLPFDVYGQFIINNSREMIQFYTSSDKYSMNEYIGTIYLYETGGIGHSPTFNLDYLDLCSLISVHFKNSKIISDYRKKIKELKEFYD